MVKKNQVKEIFLQSAELLTANTWKIEHIPTDKESFLIYFGKFVKEDEVQVVSRIKLPLGAVEALTESFLKFAFDMNKDYNLQMKLFENVQVVEREEKNEDGGNA